MHRVKVWAHSSAHASKYNPWSQTVSVAAATGVPAASSSLSDATTPADEEKEKCKTKIPVLKRFNATLRKIILHSWVNVLLIFVPVGIAAHFAGLSPTAVFALNAIAIIPLAGLLTFATESVAHRLGDTLGALLNVSFAYANQYPSIIALVKNEIRIVQASLLGSILANLLLILGMAFLIGGLEYREQIYNSTVTQMSSCLLCLAVLSLLIPTAFHASFSDIANADKAVLKVSRGTSVILLLVYVLYLLFQLKSHSYMYKSTPQHIVDEESHPGILRRMHSSSSSSAPSVNSGSSSHNAGSKRRTAKRLRARLGKKRTAKTEVSGDLPEASDSPQKATPANGEVNAEAAVPSSLGNASPQRPSPTPIRSKSMLPSMSFRTPPVFRASTDPISNLGQDNSPNLRLYRSVPTGLRKTSTPQTNTDGFPIPEPDTEPPMSRTASVILLLASTALVALCAEFLVGSIGSLVATTPLSEAFVGLIILPIVGNAAEHVTAVTVAAKNKMDLAIGVAIGSSIQIALFITPIVVILGWILNKDMSLYFNLFETVALFVATFVVNFLVLDGRSNYLEGSLLCACYVIIAVAAFFFPDSQDQSTYVSGPDKRDLARAMLGNIIAV